MLIHTAYLLCKNDVYFKDWLSGLYLHLLMAWACAYPVWASGELRLCKGSCVKFQNMAVASKKGYGLHLRVRIAQAVVLGCEDIHTEITCPHHAPICPACMSPRAGVREDGNGQGTLWSWVPCACPNQMGFECTVGSKIIHLFCGFD